VDEFQSFALTSVEIINQHILIFCGYGERQIHQDSAANVSG
jgi:hypothetical protein